MKRQIRGEGVRDHELSDRGVKCPNAVDDNHSPYGVVANPGNWIVYEDSDRFTYGRVLGRVSCPAGSLPEMTPIEGWLSVVVLGETLTHAFVRWVDPKDVRHVHTTPPRKMLDWITGPMPTPDMVYRLAHYGTLSESYVDKAAHHVNAWQHGVGPVAWDLGYRSVDADGHGVKGSDA